MQIMIRSECLTKLPEESSTDGKQTPGHDRTFERFSWIFQILWQEWQSFVVKLPIEGTTGPLVLGSVLKIVEIHNINKRTNCSSVVLKNVTSRK